MPAHRLPNLLALAAYLIVTTCALVGPVLCVAADHVKLEGATSAALDGTCDHAGKPAGLETKTADCTDVALAVPVSLSSSDCYGRAALPPLTAVIERPLLDLQACIAVFAEASWHPLTVLSHQRFIDHARSVILVI